MSVSDHLRGFDSDQLQRDFLAIVHGPANKNDSYKAAAERITARLEAADDSRTKSRFVVVKKNGGFLASSVVWTEKAHISSSGHDPQFGEASVRAKQAIAVGAVAPGEAQTHTVSIGYSVYYRVCWMFIGLCALVWGVVVGASAAGTQWVGLSTAISGVIGVLGLMVTLFIAGRKSGPPRT